MTVFSFANSKENSESPCNTESKQLERTAEVFQEAEAANDIRKSSNSAKTDVK
jgi:hypothetical protein